MSRGFGSLQRRVLEALMQRTDDDCYVLRPEYPYDQLVVTDDMDDMPGAARARWRWYTIDLLGLVGLEAPRSDRESLHRAIRCLAKYGHIELCDHLPYDQPFATQNPDHHSRCGFAAGSVDLSELSWIDDRWPRRPGRVLWFRKIPPQLAEIPVDDQIAILDAIQTYRPDAFEDFVGTTDHRERWRTPTGQFLRWLFCGHQDLDEKRSGSISRPTRIMAKM